MKPLPRRIYHNLQRIYTINHYFTWFFSRYQIYSQCIKRPFTYNDYLIPLLRDNRYAQQLPRYSKRSVVSTARVWSFARRGPTNMDSNGLSLVWVILQVLVNAPTGNILAHTAHITVTSQWAWWLLRSPASWLFTPTVYSGADQWIHQSSASLAFARGIHRWPVNSPHKCPVTRKMFSFDDVIMNMLAQTTTLCSRRRIWDRVAQCTLDHACSFFHGPFY